MVGPVWSCIVVYGFVWLYIVWFGLEQSALSCTVLFNQVWLRMVLFALEQSYTVSNGHVGSCVVLYGFVWSAGILYILLLAFMYTFVLSSKVT